VNNLRVDIVGREVSAYLDGFSLFTPVAFDREGQGSVAIYTWGAPNTSLDNVRVVGINAGIGAVTRTDPTTSCNLDATVIQKNGKEITCRSLAKKGERAINKKCRKNSAIAETCSGVCERKCKCLDVGSDKFMNRFSRVIEDCADLQSLKFRKRKKKCSKVNSNTKKVCPWTCAEVC